MGAVATVWAQSASMSLPGKFDVSATGAAVYSIPIAVPPGTAGMAPTLSLDYSSQGGDGIVGIGWSLGGLASVTRCPQTFAQDGVRGTSNFDANDRFCLDGQRLMAINNGTYGADGTEYRTEIESFTRVISHGTAGNGPAWFEVHTKSGQTMEFGHTLDSQILAQGKTTARSWALNKVADTKGNFYTVTYTNDTTNGQAYPIEIDYTGNAAASLAPYNKVQFVYATRPDITPLYQAGSLSRTTVRLTNVKTFTGTTLISDHQIGYDATAPKPSHVSSIKLCAADGTCIPQTSFVTTIGGDGNFTPLPVSTLGGGLNVGAPSNNFGLLQGDFDGDGKSDFLFVRSAMIYSFFSNGDGTFIAKTFAGPVDFTAAAFTNYAAFSGDFNGDGKTDFAMVRSSTVYVLLSNGDGTFTTKTYMLPNGMDLTATVNANYWSFAGDFNGDGRIDLAFLRSNFIIVLLSNGDGTFTTQNIPVPNGWDFGVPSNNFALLQGDFNGDGKSDIAMARSSTVYVLLSKGEGSFTGNPYTLPWDLGADVGSNWWTPVGDFNGDGKTDLAFLRSANTIVLLSKGDGTFTAQSTANPNGWDFGVPSNNFALRLGDFNGDGKADFVMLRSATAYGMLSNGDGTFSGKAYTFTNGWDFGADVGSNYYTPIGDVDGDGKTDLVFVRSTSINSALASGQSYFQLKSIANGLSATTSITYQPLTKTSVYTKDTNAVYPIQDMQAPMFVVSRVDTSNGIGGTISSTYNYAGAKSDLSGRGFLGFRQQTATDLQTNIVQTSNLRQDFPYLGLVASTSKKLNNTTLNQITNTYGSTALGGARSQVFLSQSVAASSDLDGTALPTLTTSYQYDAFGNATQVTTSTSDGFSKTTANTYTNDTTKWLLGRLTGASVTSTTP
jgi:hypothetical protein